MADKNRLMKKLGLTLGLICSMVSGANGEWTLGERLKFSKGCDASCSDQPSCDSCNDCSSCDQSSCCPPCAHCKYVTFFGGWNHLQDYRGEEDVPPFIQRQGTFDDGFLVGTAIGWCVTTHLRHEVEFAYRFNQGDTWSSNPLVAQRVPLNWNGSLNTYSGMTNLIYDFGDRNSQRLTPYVGGGIGFAILDGKLNSPNTQFQFDETAFAYQGFAGAMMKARKNASLFSEYRFFGTDQVDLFGSGAVIDQHQYLAHNVIFGIQFRR